MKIKLHYFNPGHEGAILNGSPYYMAPANVLKMRKDLEFLPAWYTDPEDFIFVENKLPHDFQVILDNHSIKLAKSITEEDLSKLYLEYQFYPWGISPQVLHYFQEISEKLCLKSHIPRWNRQITDFTSRKYALKFMEELQRTILPDLDESIKPQIIHNLTDIDNIVSNCNFPLLAKAPFSSSGRGLLWLPVGNLPRSERQILHGIIRKQGFVCLEKVLNKKLDFAMEFLIQESLETTFEGFSLFKNSSKGGYLGNYLDTQENIELKINSFIDSVLLENVKTELKQIIKREFGSFYSGYVGIDMMVYEEDGKNKLHPCVEINMRNNMGMVATKISNNFMDSYSYGMFYLDFESNEGKLLENDIEMKKKYPVVFHNGKIQSGYLSLCPIDKNTKYRAYILVENKAK